MADMKARFVSPEVIYDLFSPILTFNHFYSDGLNIKSMSFVSKYPDDFSDGLIEEMMHMKSVNAKVFDSEKYSLKLINFFWEVLNLQ